MFAKNDNVQLIKEINKPFFLNETCYLWPVFKELNLFSLNQQAWSWETQTDWGSQKPLIDRLMHF